MLAPTPRGGRRGLAAVVGVSAAVLGVGVAEVVAIAIDPAAGPFVAIAGVLVDGAPPAAKDIAIALFGTADKPALLVAIGVVLIAGGALAGVLEHRRSSLGVIVVLAAGAAGIAAAMTRLGATPAWVLPSLLGAGVSVAVLRALIARLHAADVVTEMAAAVTTSALSPPSVVAPGPSRRSVLLAAGAAGLVGVLGVIGGRVAEAAVRAAAAIREAVRLPAPARPAPAIPAGAEFRVPGLSPLITPNRNFYRIDIAFAVPRIDPATWALRVSGLVEREVTLAWDELLASPLEEHDATLICVSNPVGGDLVGTARWLGFPVRELLGRAGVLSEADMVLSVGADGFTASTPLDALTDPERPALLAVGMNGEPLPYEHGFPARLVVPGLYGYVSATKWVQEFRVTRFDEATAYWTDRGWSPRGPVKLHSRIDVPRSGAHVPADDAVIAGVAWHPHTGIAGVDIQLDGGAWIPADISAPINSDCWVQWRVAAPVPAGSHLVRVRATSVDGEVQTEHVVGTVPDGATGLHSVRFSAG